MPVPPYGSFDIPGSDTASKLIVNQPNGNTEVTITGVMNGLNPNTEYTVFISNGYTKFVGWNMVGNWALRFTVNGDGSYDHDLFITNQSSGTFTGTAEYPSGGPYTTHEGLSGTIGVTISGKVTLHVTQGANYYADGVGLIDYQTGKMSGTWNDNIGNTGIFSTLSGAASSIGGGSTGWPGLFNTQQTFTFMTDAYGTGSWHVNLKDTDLPEGITFNLSVWINEGGTMLISDPFTITKG